MLKLGRMNVSIQMLYFAQANWFKSRSHSIPVLPKNGKVSSLSIFSWRQVQGLFRFPPDNTSNRKSEDILSKLCRGTNGAIKISSCDRAWVEVGYQLYIFLMIRDERGGLDHSVSGFLYISFRWFMRCRAEQQVVRNVVLPERTGFIWSADLSSLQLISQWPQYCTTNSIFMISLCCLFGERILTSCLCLKRLLLELIYCLQCGLWLV